MRKVSMKEREAVSDDWDRVVLDKDERFANSSHQVFGKALVRIISNLLVNKSY